MGNLNCAKCCQGSEIKHEIDLKFSITALNINKETQPTEMTSCIQKSAIQIQSFWRRCKAAGLYQSLKKDLSKSFYFCDEDIFETLSPSIPTETFDLSYTYSSGAVYEGHWLGGFRHGLGKCLYLDGSKYVGSWFFGYPFGQGSFTFKDGETYTGTWINPYASIKNRSFLQDIKQGKRDGYGKFQLVWLNCKTSLKYKKMSHKKCLKKIEKKFKEMKEIIREGQQDLAEKEPKDLENGYQGELDGENRNGFGVNIWENGDVYIGYWQDDKQNGWGRNEWVDGSKYIGQYVNNLKEGLGEYVWEDGTQYIGEWKNNIIHGIGKYIWQDGREYLGQWNQGLMSGFGVHKFLDGRRYEGSWKLGKKHGTGYSFSSTGCVKNTWQEGKIKK